MMASLSRSASTLVAKTTSSRASLCLLSFWRSTATSARTPAETLEEAGSRAAPVAAPKVKAKAKVNSNVVVSSAMKSYMERKRRHDAFMAQERAEFELGRKHLANMMGVPDTEAMAQEDIDRAIQYLFPSGLQHPDARPVMKPPEEIFPKQKDAEFDADGRPFHPFFYCVKPGFYQAMYETVEQAEGLALFSERMARQRKDPDPDQVLSEAVLSSTRWMNHEELCKRFLEDVTQSQADELVVVLERLLENPFAYKARDFVFQFRTACAATKSSVEKVVPEYDAATGTSVVQYLGQRKSALAKVKVTKPGTGQLTITHIDYPEHHLGVDYFYSMKEREQVLYPLQFSKLLGRVDVECTVDAGGSSSQAGAIRYALAMCLQSLVDEETATDMKVAGLLTQDIRVHERKKPGQWAARRKYTWKKR